MLPHRLILFVKNPIAGNVKTRLAKTIGNTGAVWVYERLLDYTRELIDTLPEVTKVVYYGDYVGEGDLWEGYPKALQVAGDLGQRMQAAFEEQFLAGAERVVIIGSDCPELRPEHIRQAYEGMSRTEVVIGPSADGGYYLLGMSKLHATLFENMPWSTAELLDTTLHRLREAGLSYTLLPMLHDLDDWDDYQRAVASGLLPLYTE